MVLGRVVMSRRGARGARYPCQRVKEASRSVRRAIARSKTKDCTSEGWTLSAKMVGRQFCRSNFGRTGREDGGSAVKGKPMLVFVGGSQVGFVGDFLVESVECRGGLDICEDVGVVEIDNPF